MDTTQDARFAAEFDADISIEKIAEVYAEAFLNAVEAQNGSVAESVEEFESFVGLLQAQEKFAAVLASEMVGSDEKLALLEKIIIPKASPLFGSFLRTVARRNRLAILIPVFRKVRAELDKRENRIPVVITTATELDAELLQRLTEKLRALIGGEPVIRNALDTELIGGLVIRVGDTIYDASILTQLKNVRQQMIDRSVYEIQCRRNIFCNPEGN